MDIFHIEVFKEIKHFLNIIHMIKLNVLLSFPKRMHYLLSITDYQPIGMVQQIGTFSTKNRKKIDILMHKTRISLFFTIFLNNIYFKYVIAPK